MSTSIRSVDTLVDTPDGPMQTYVTRPDHDRPVPLVVFLMDAPGKRPLLHGMADRIAGHGGGHHVVLPNLYHRATDHFELDFQSAESLQRMTELMYGVGTRQAMADVEVLLDVAAADPTVDASQVGVVGYCMSGPFAIVAAARFAPRVRCAASFYGVRLVVDQPDSPHALLPEVAGELYVACAEHDDYVPLAMVDDFEAAFVAAGTRGSVERYWGMHHGFAFGDRAQHDPEGERRHWEALLSLFDRNLATTPDAR